MIPDPDSIDIKKLGDGGSVGTDTCAAAQKERKILVKTIGGRCHEQDCMNHLRNVWINGMSKDVSKFLNEYLADSLEEISSILRVNPDLSMVIRAYDKQFSGNCNYAKGGGEEFGQFMHDNHSEGYLYGVTRSAGSRQDLICMGSIAIYMNRNYNVEFLAEKLEMKDHENILEENLFTVLVSSEMISVARFWAIVHVAIVMPVRWLSGCTHELAEYNWGPRSMGRVIDALHSACLDILNDNQLIHDKSYMMHIFDEFAEELPPFKEYLQKMFEEKTSNYVVKREDKALPYKMLLEELFSPTDSDNKDSTPVLEEVAKIGVAALQRELEDKKKATFKYLSLSGSEFSWEHCPEQTKKDMLGMWATNDLAESSFGGVTLQVQCFGRIGLCNAAAISDMRMNSFLSRPTTSKEMESDKRGLVHGLPEELKITLLMVAMEDAPATRQSNRDALSKQREMKKKKKELAQQKELADKGDQYISSLIYHAMWGTEACWTTEKQITAGLKALQFKKDKLQALKDNIQMWWKGFGFEEQCKTTWSENGKQKTVSDLTKRLKEILKMWKKEKWVIPDKPKVPVRKRKDMAQLGTLTNFVKYLDEKAEAGSSEFENKYRQVWRERNIQGVSSLEDKRRQEVSPPAIDETLKGFRIEMVFEFDPIDEDGNVIETEPKELCWCSGTVKEICDGTWIKNGRERAVWKAGEAIEVDWDPIGDTIPGGVTRVAINPRKWNKDVVDGWRKHLPPIDYGLKE